MSYIESKFVNASGKMAKMLTQNMYRDGTGVVSDTIHVDGFLAALDNGNTYSAYAGVTRADLGVANGKIGAVVKSGYMLETPSMVEYAKAA